MCRLKRWKMCRSSLRDDCAVNDRADKRSKLIKISRVSASRLKARPGWLPANSLRN
ncbi:hypothetical protein D3C77_252060 [compost metagenome]